MNAVVKALVMPFSNTEYLRFPDKVKAARLAGFDHMSMIPFQVRHEIEAGFSIPEMLRIAAGNGIQISRLDPLAAWTRIWQPDNMNEEHIATVAETPDDFFRMAGALGCTSMTLNGQYPYDSMPTDEIIEHYARVCARAGEFGMTCDLEFIPAWGVRDLATAWHIVKSSGAKNGGIVFDALHFVRSHSSLDLLAEIPGEFVRCVQLNDGPLDLPPNVSLTECIFDREFPGDGAFPLTDILGVLAKTGGLNQVAPEVFSPKLRGRSAEWIAEKSRRSLEFVFTRAGLLLSR